MFVRKRLLASALCALLIIPTSAILAQEAPTPVKAPSEDSATLADQFRDPPERARARVWWHWMNGNVTKDGIAKDLAWMKRIGIGGLQNFDVNFLTPQIVDHRLAYMTPEWKDAFRFAASEADRLGLEFAIASSPGWSETGGPWVLPKDGLKKLVWSEVNLAPGKRLVGSVPAPSGVTGPYQSIPAATSMEALIAGQPAPKVPVSSGDAGLIAYPVPIAAELPAATGADTTGKALDVASLADANLDEGASLGRKDGQPLGLTITYARPATIRSATVFLPNIVMPFAGSAFSGVIESSDDGLAWNKVADVKLGSVPTTVSFMPTTARQFRLLLNPVAFQSGLVAPAPGVAIGDLFGGASAALAASPTVVGTFVLTADPQIDRFQTKAGFDVSRDYYALTGPDDGAVGVDPSKVVVLDDRLKPDGTLDWTAPRLPKGQVWRVVRFGWSLVGTTNHPAPSEATGLEVDKYDGPAVRAYLEHYLGMYRDAAGSDLIGKRGVRAMLTDSIEVGAANWTPQMLVQFKRLRGYDPRPWLPTLTGQLVGTRADTDRFLYDFRRTLADLLASEHYGTIAKVAHEHGLTVYGEALEDKRPMLGDDMAMRSHADIPMAAMWAFGPEGPRPGLIADIKGAASVAHLYGRQFVAAESMTSAMAPWAFAPSDLKHIIDLEFAAGVNRPVIHTSVHVPVDGKKPGLSLFIFGQYFNRNETWAEMAKPWVDYISRSSLLLQTGRNVADVAYFSGEEAPLTGLYGDNPVADTPVTVAYDFLDFDALTGLLANDGTDVVSPGGARYRAIQLGGSSREMTLPALRKLAALVDGGATLIGDPPVGNPSLAGDNSEFAALVARLWPGSGDARVGKGRVLAGRPVKQALALAGISPDFAFTGGSIGADIPFVHRRDADGDIYFLVNRNAAPETITAHFRIAGKRPELWHAETGTSELVSYRIVGDETLVTLGLRSEEAVFVVFREPAPGETLTLPTSQARPVAALSDNWTVAFQPDRGAPPSIAMPRLVPLQVSADPGVRYFSGIATYSRTFNLPAGAVNGMPLWLDLGTVGDLAQVSINGVDVGTAWHAPHRLDIARAARKGRNRIEIRVANTWVNRLIGDAQPGAKPITWTATPTYLADAPLHPSGLVGPVELSVGGQ